MFVRIIVRSSELLLLVLEKDNDGKIGNRTFYIFFYVYICLFDLEKVVGRFEKRRFEKIKAWAVLERVLFRLWLNKKRALHFLQATALRKRRETESWTTTTLVLTVIPKSDERQSNAGILQLYYYPLCVAFVPSFINFLSPSFLHVRNEKWKKRVELTTNLILKDEYEFRVSKT